MQSTRWQLVWILIRLMQSMLSCHCQHMWNTQRHKTSNLHLQGTRECKDAVMYRFWKWTVKTAIGYVDEAVSSNLHKTGGCSHVVITAKVKLFGDGLDPVADNQQNIHDHFKLEERAV